MDPAALEKFRRELVARGEAQAGGKITDEQLD
jgi:hypothetical protein